MTFELLVVLAVLAAAIVLFALGRPRMDVVALLVIVALPLTGILTVPEALSGFSDPNVILIAALFVVGAGLSRTGVTYRLGDLLSARAGSNRTLLVVLLMLAVALLGSIMSSTGVVAIFIPVALSIAARTGMSPRQLLMPLSFAGLISGMLTLIATAPNLVVDAELRRAGFTGFGFFTFTPIGLVVLVLGVGYMLVARRFLGGEASAPGVARNFEVLVADYGADTRARTFRVGSGSPLIGRALLGLEIGEVHTSVLAIQRGRFLRGPELLTSTETTVKGGDELVFDLAPPEERLEGLGLEEVETPGDFFDTYSRQVGMAELLVVPDSRLAAKTVVEARIRSRYDVTVLGLRHHGRPPGQDYHRVRLAVGDTLLVTGTWDAIHRLRRESADLVVLDLPTEAAEAAPAANRAPYALVAVGVMIALMVTGVVPNVIAALIAALLMGVFRAIDLPSAYRAIHWPTLLLIAGMLPVAQALEKTGGVQLAADGLLAVLGGAGPYVVLALLFAVTALVGMFVSNTATAVLLAPVAITAAQHLGYSPYPFAMIVAIAASAAFLTPVSSPVNTLVVEPGRYRLADFVRIGTPFTLIVLVVSVFLVPVVLPF
ncbi:SLC13 family permease [Protaetiibacter intestinalis]|uniref:SLC13 family permease n=1 Tax=Protaetiibacter intestinalis TaxID=2419774 RepID=A0A387B9X5_9MICO|nr:SLC13 family permease [Protaetiibacter intestinalis]AYF97916.1 SLC13 family permease [Protaetiibacter intestinalis]